jgi:hypothetical protein
MFRKLMNTGIVEIDGHGYALRYYEQETLRGIRRYSCEIVLGASDWIILDGESLSSLEMKVARLAPAMLYSRLLASRTSVAA